MKINTKRTIVYVVLASTLSFLVGYLQGQTMPPSSMTEKYNGVFMQMSKATPNLHYLLLNGETFAEKPEDKEKLNDADFAKAIKETEGRPLYELSAKKGALTHEAIDSLQGQSQLRKLNLAQNKTMMKELLEI